MFKFSTLEAGIYPNESYCAFSSSFSSSSSFPSFPSLAFLLAPSPPHSLTPHPISLRHLHSSSSPTFHRAPTVTSSDNSGNTSDNAFDSCHINTVNLYAANATASDDDLYLISLRGPSTLYLINGAGEIVWRLGGKYSNFTMSGVTNTTSTGATFVRLPSLPPRFHR
jgi:hypothetical protein